MQKDIFTLIDKYCENLRIERNASIHTCRNYKIDIEAFCLWCNRNNVNPFTIDVFKLRLYLVELDGAQYSQSTINRHLSSLRSFFLWLDISGICKNSVFSSISGPKMPKLLPHKVRLEDLEKLFSMCQKNIKDNENNSIRHAIEIRDYAILEFFYATGARISEVANLRITNIDNESMQVKLMGKGSKQRLVPLHKRAAKSLSKYINNARDLLLSNSASNTKKNFHKDFNSCSDICFIGASGKPFSADSIRNMFYNKCKLAGISSHISPHSMRHSFASDVLEGGADLRSIQEMLGHASLSTTQIYTHLSTKKLKDVHSQAHPRG